jgi:hypothetical protein
MTGMSKPPPHPTAAEGANVFHRELEVQPARVSAIVVEMAQWDRFKRRVGELESTWSLNWLVGAAGASVSLATGAAIAALALPSGEGTGISDTVEPVLWVLAAVSLVLTAALTWLAWLAHSERQGKGTDIVDEMTTTERAWRGFEELLIDKSPENQQE